MHTVPVVDLCFHRSHTQVESLHMPPSTTHRGPDPCTLYRGHARPPVPNFVTPFETSKPSRELYPVDARRRPTASTRAKFRHHTSKYFTTPNISELPITIQLYLSIYDPCPCTTLVVVESPTASTRAKFRHPTLKQTPHIHVFFDRIHTRARVYIYIYTYPSSNQADQEMTVSRSQRSGCSTGNDTPVHTQVVCK